MVIQAIIGVLLILGGWQGLGSNSIAPILIIEGMILVNFALLSNFRGKNINRM